MDFPFCKWDKQRRALLNRKIEVYLNNIIIHYHIVIVTIQKLPKLFCFL